VADGCVFCAIVAGEAPAEVVHEWRDVLAIVPLNPVVKGHVIVLPKDHVRDALADRSGTSTCTSCRAEPGMGCCCHGPGKCPSASGSGSSRWTPRSTR
jgi:hypothetical protein